MKRHPLFSTALNQHCLCVLQWLYRNKIVLHTVQPFTLVLGNHVCCHIFLHITFLLMFHPSIPQNKNTWYQNYEWLKSNKNQWKFQSFTIIYWFMSVWLCSVTIRFILNCSCFNTKPDDLRAQIKFENTVCKENYKLHPIPPDTKNTTIAKPNRVRE